MSDLVVAEVVALAALAFALGRVSVYHRLWRAERDRLRAEILAHQEVRRQLGAEGARVAEWLIDELDRLRDEGRAGQG